MVVGTPKAIARATTMDRTDMPQATELTPASFIAQALSNPVNADGIDRYLIACTCVGIDTRSRALYAPNGLDELQRGILRMNPRFAQPAMFRDKARSYQERWPWLSIVPAEEEGGVPSVL